MVMEKRHVISKAPALVSVSISENPNLVGLQTRRPLLRGFQSIVTMRGDFRPYMRYLEGNDLTDMASDWRLVGSDIRVAMNYLKRQ